MAHETIDGTYRQTNLRNESPEYLRKREELRLAEIELLNQRERVAALRRQLPTGATLQDYDLLEEPASLDAGDVPIARARRLGRVVGLRHGSSNAASTYEPVTADSAVRFTAPPRSAPEFRPDPEHRTRSRGSAVLRAHARQALA